MKPQRAPVSQIGEYALPHTVGAHLPTPGKAPGWPMANIGQWRIDVNGVVPVWLAEMKVWRHEHLIRMGYDDAEYRRPELAWTQRNLVHTQMMVEDRYFYDPVAGKYTVDKYLDDLERRFGGIDSVLIWYVYTNIGIDDRNQTALASDLPGGLEGLKQAIADFHRRGVKVFLPTMAWDNGTKGEGVPDWEAVKWLEPRHVINIENRWARDRTDDFHYMFFNGMGYVAWENVWGVWNQFTARDGEALRRLATLLRKFADLFVSLEWEPYALTLQRGVFASKFPSAEKTLWSIVNRNEYDMTGEQLAVAHRAGRTYYDLWNGVRLSPRIINDHACISLNLETRGYGAVLAVESGASVEGLDALLAQMKKYNEVSLQSLSNVWQAIPQQIVEIAPTRPSPTAPEGMVTIPAGEFDFVVGGIEIEGYTWKGLDFQYPWENSARRSHRHRMQIKSFHIDKYPVTNAQFKQFMDASGYRPKDAHNFLRDWINGAPRKGWEQKPVTWVSIEDARAYAAWAGKRLPHEWEWQYAAQGTDGRLYPWGNDWNTANMPAQSKARETPIAADVDAHPRGASPFGVMDLVGNVWQWTDEFHDEHTRAAALRGGSAYQPQTSRRAGRGASCQSFRPAQPLHRR